MKIKIALTVLTMLVLAADVWILWTEWRPIVSTTAPPDPLKLCGSSILADGLSPVERCAAAVRIEINRALSESDRAGRTQ